MSISNLMSVVREIDVNLNFKISKTTLTSYLPFSHLHETYHESSIGTMLNSKEGVHQSISLHGLGLSFHSP